jgi:hypothetical protein
LSSPVIDSGALLSTLPVMSTLASASEVVEKPVMVPASPVRLAS